MHGDLVWSTSKVSAQTGAPKVVSCGLVNRAAPTVVGIFHYGARRN